MAKKATVKRIIKGRDYNDDKRQDGLRSARAFGWRKAGTSRKPTKKEIQDHYDGAKNSVYMENRPERGDNFGRAKKGERFEKGGSIDSTMKFHLNDYNKLLDADEYDSIKNGNVWEIKDIETSKVYGKYNKEKGILIIVGKKDLSNPLVVWLKDNSYISSDNVNKLAKGGEIKASDVKDLANGYKSAILFTSTDEDDTELDYNYSVSDFDSKSNAVIEKMAKQYISDNKEAIDKAIESGMVDYDQIGMDIWYAQSGQGVGFFDRNLDKDVEEKLTKGAKKFGDLSHHVFAQDGKVYIEGMKFAKGGEVDNVEAKSYKINNTTAIESELNKYLYDLKIKEYSNSMGTYSAKLTGKQLSDLIDLISDLDKNNNVYILNSMNEVVYDSAKKDKFAKGGKVDRTKSIKKNRVNRTKKAIAQDKNIKALHAGKRLSENDEVYYEYRLNRSDVNRTKKLAKGGEIKASDVKDLANGYKSAILFTSTDEDDTELDYNYSVSDFDSKSNAVIEKMAKQYISDNKEAIDKAIESGMVDYDQIGMDIWYAQSGQGVGFFDRNLDKDVEEKLTKGAKKFGDLSHHVFAQDGKVYIEGMKFAKGGEVDNVEAKSYKINNTTAIESELNKYLYDLKIKEYSNSMGTYSAKLTGKQLSDLIDLISDLDKNNNVYILNSMNEVVYDSAKKDKFAKGVAVKNRTTLSEEEKQFVREESQEAGQGYTYRAKLLRGEHIILKEKDGQPIQKFTVDNFEVGNKMSAMLNKANDKEKKVKLNKVDRSKAVKKTSVNRTKKLAKGGNVGKNKLTYEIKEIPAYNQLDEEVGKWYRIYDNKGRLKTLFMRNWLNSDKKHSVTEVGDRELAEKILAEINSGKHNEDKIVTGKDSNYDNGIISETKDSYTDIDEIKFAKGGDLKNYTSADLPKDSSNIYIYMPEYNSLPEGYVVFRYNKSHGMFDLFVDEKLGATRIDEKYILDNLNNGVYVLKNEEDYNKFNKLEELEDGKYARGGHVSKGELVWGKLSSSDKINFLYENFTPEITPRSQETLVGKTFNFLPKNVKIKIESKYANTEEYAKGGTIKEVDFENSNVIFYGFSHDKNGNSVVKVGFPNQSAFSLQINDPSWFRFTKGKYTKNVGELEPSDIIKIEEEVVEYIRNFGSKKQKESLKVYSKFKGGVRDAKEVNVLLQDAIKKTKDLSAKEIADMWNSNINTEISKSWNEEEVSKNISHFRSYLKDLLFEKQLTEAEYSEYFKDGGSIGFEGLAKKVAKEYEGDKVKPEYQDEYGKRYDKEEAKEVGAKVAAKVYQMQQSKLEQGGEVKGMLSLSEIESKLGKTFSFWNVPYEVSVNGNTYRKILHKNEYKKI